MSKKYKIYLCILSTIIILFLGIKTLVFLDFLKNNLIMERIEYLFFLVILPILFFKILQKGGSHLIYIKKLNNVLTQQSHDSKFFKGDIVEGSKNLISEVSQILNVERTSIWIYNDDKTSISCQQLFEKKTNQFSNNIEIFSKDYFSYFQALEKNPIIIANDAEKHPATSCFSKNYLIPLGIKSMLDVPIIYRGKTVGVICLESTFKRKWREDEVNFIQIFSSLYSLAWAGKESEKLYNNLKELESFVDESVLFSKTDKNGLITYVNKKFVEISGYSLDESIGRNHNFLNSDVHPPEFWEEMYKKTLSEKKVWNGVITNKNKSGDFYYVDSYIKANFDKMGNLKGFASIRQDVTQIKAKEQEIRNRMNAINKSNLVIEFDLSGKIIFANSKFLELTGYSAREIIGKDHSIFMTKEDVIKTKECDKFWKRLSGGQFISDIFRRKKRNGSIIWLRSTYNPIFDVNGRVYRVLKIAIDVTESIEQSEELVKKNTYLEHAAKILRHDMHSGINTYIPRGISSLERRLKGLDLEGLKLDTPLKLLKEGLKHTQKVYNGVYQFTNLVKEDAVLEMKDCDVKNILIDFLGSTSYKSQVVISDNIPIIYCNESLFCTAVDNLIRNGLKYNDSNKKMIKIYFENKYIVIEDNGRGLTQEEFDEYSKGYKRKSNQKEGGTGLGLNICKAILDEHDFEISVEKLSPNGTKLKIKIK
jgi:hypothetical protein